LCIGFVVQAGNFREMADFVQLGKRFNADGVYFSSIRKWGRAMTEETFFTFDVRRPAHPLHAELRRVLQERIFEDPIVELGDLSPLRSLA
jgi:hypothetical protein